MKLKVCGMKHNTMEVASLGPDFLGFIFWEGSPRHFEGPALPTLPEGIIPVGVFVDTEPDIILSHVQGYALGAVQMHGQESPAYCRDLRMRLNGSGLDKTQLIKAFSIGEKFSFDILQGYLSYCDYFLFDTKGRLPGGTGRTFNWEVLQEYPYEKPFLLSGGIGEAHCLMLQEFLSSPKAKFCLGIDVNSKFETEPGLKDTEALRRFLECGCWTVKSPGLEKT